MASPIATHTRDLVQKLADAMDDLRMFESVTADCQHKEDLQDCWMLRNKLLSVAEQHWTELGDLLLKQVIPFVSDFQKGVDHG